MQTIIFLLILIISWVSSLLFLDSRNDAVIMGVEASIFFYVVGYYFKDNNDFLARSYSNFGVWAGAVFGMSFLMVAWLAILTKGYNFNDLIIDKDVLRPIRKSPIVGSGLLFWSLLVTAESGFNKLFHFIRNRPNQVESDDENRQQ